MIEPARRLLAAFGLSLATIFAWSSGVAQAQTPFVQAPTAQPKYAAVVVDATSGEVLYAKRADSPRYPASITKIMTLYLTFDALSTGRLRADDPVIISSRAAAQGPTKLGLPAGDSLTVSDAMQALAIKSANDVAVALAETLGGTESRFAAMMTLRAQDLGMANTHFVNASGLPDSRQVSTARDIAILSRAVMRDYPQYYRLFSQQQFAFRGMVMNNHNGLLGRMVGVDGLKTGFTNASGHNLAVSAVRDNHRLIAIVMGGPSNASRDMNAEHLLLTGFDVLARRERGENIVIAQNMFEPEPIAPFVPPSSEQGDDDTGKVAFVSAPAPANLSKFQIVDPKTTGLHIQDAGQGLWAIQVGAFKTKALAQTQLGITQGRFNARVASAARRVADPLGGVWRAQFQGMSETAAKDACTALKAKRQACIVVSPG